MSLRSNVYLAAITALCALTATAAEFHPINDVATNMVDGNPGGNPVTNIYEGPGIGFGAAEPHDGPSNVWYTDDPGGFPSDYISVHEGPEYIWLDLGSDLVLSEISFWAYSTGNSNGMREFNLSFATEAEGGEAALGDEMYGTSITANPSFEAIQNNVPRQSFRFNAVTARYVRVEATSTFFEQPDAGAGGDRLGIGEIAFENVIIPDDPTITVEPEIALTGIATDIVEFDTTVANSGAAELTITGTNFTGTNASAFSVTGAPASIASLSSDIITMEFDPTGLEGPISATLQIMSNDPATPTAEIMITGTVPPTEQNIVVSDPPVDRSLAAVKNSDILVENNGGTVLALNSASFVGPDAAAYSVLDVPATVDPIGSAAIQIAIDPAGREGNLSATLQIASDDPDSPVVDVLVEAVALGEAASFFTISSVESSTSADDFYPVANLIQGAGNGFDAISPYIKLLDGETGNWVTSDPGGFPSDYVEDTGKPILIFDLGENTPLGEVSMWGYAATNSNGVSEFSLRFATAAEGADGFGGSIAYNPFFAGIDSGEFPNGDNTSRFSFPFEEGVFARYVELTCEDNYFIAPGTGAGGEIPGGDRVGLGEVAFSMLAAPSGIPFQILSIDVAAGEVTLVFTSRPGLSYSIYRSNDLGATGWEELDDSYMSQGDTTTFVDDSLEPGTQRVYYQVRPGEG